MACKNSMSVTQVYFEDENIFNMFPWTINNNQFLNKERNFGKICWFVMLDKYPKVLNIYWTFTYRKLDFNLEVWNGLSRVIALSTLTPINLSPISRGGGGGGGKSDQLIWG